MNQALYQFTLRLADTHLILGQKLSEWVGHGPFLEEELALTNIALDHIGTANALFEYASSLTSFEKSADQIAFLRHEREFYNLLITEQPNGDYANTIVRQYLVDSFFYYYLQAMVSSKDETLAGIAQKSLKEVTYHKRHTASWVIRFGNGTNESHQKIQQALNTLWQFTDEFFEKDAFDEIIIKQGISSDAQVFKQQWLDEITTLFTQANITIPENVFMQTGSKKGLHTEHLAFILAEMQALPRMFPNDKW